MTAPKKRMRARQAEQTHANNGSDEVDELFKRYAGAGVSEDPDDQMWLGSPLGSIDVEAILASEVEPHSSLKSILAAIIAAHPDDSRCRKPEERLEEAFSALVGVARSPGMYEFDDQRIIIKAARLVFTRSKMGGPRKGVFSWRACLKEAYGLEGWNALSTGQSAALYRRLMAKIGKIGQDRLLVQASSGDSHYVQARDEVINRVLRDLRRLGIHC